MRMSKSEAKIPPWDVGALNKHGPPLARPPSIGQPIGAMPRARDPVRSRAPARHQAPARHLPWFLVIRAPSLQWESYVRPPTESRPTRLVLRGNNYWDHDRPPERGMCQSRQRIQSFKAGMGEVCRKGRQAVKTLTGLTTLSSLKNANGKRSTCQRAKLLNASEKKKLIR